MAKSEIESIGEEATDDDGVGADEVVKTADAHTL
jgi:hypothetical protein